ncbi:Sir2 family NAD-dependent protein deacetylase, partial [Salinicola salarius]|uniref:Sir2 family NAD-dependent protein deacetylase n=1 Tax=Salinicola salarius TaxID=430457 RepID=UPI0026EC2A5E
MSDTRSPHLVVLTGAGISAESGLKTFRDGDGLWENHRLEDVATPEAWARDPETVLRFYDERREQTRRARPNAAHLALAELEAAGFRVSVVTQNIDDLHERAGSRNLLHMHGELLRIRCNRCQAIAGWTEDLSLDQPCADCGDAGGLRPHVVWFGEMPLQMERIYQALDRCRLFISIGTSGNVWPAAGFVALAPDLYHGEMAGHTEMDRAGELMTGLPPDRAARDMSGAIDFLLAHDATTGPAVGVTGFCMG